MNFFQGEVFANKGFEVNVTYPVTLETVAI